MRWLLIVVAALAVNVAVAAETKVGVIDMERACLLYTSPSPRDS